MASKHPTIPVLDLSGTPAQIGAAHGESQRDRIRAYVDRFIGWLLQSAALALTEETLWAKWSPQVAVNQREAPELVEEMRGIARGAGVPFERIFLLNSLLDLNSFRYLDLANAFAGCSTFAVVAEAGTGKTLAGQTYDMPAFHQDYLTLLRLKPAHGPRQLVFTFAGIVGAAGLNDRGLSVNINYLSPLDVGLGRLHSVIVRQMLASTQLADALAHPVLPPRAGGAHFLVADAEGNVVSIETTAKRFAVACPVRVSLWTGTLSDCSHDRVETGLDPDHSRRNLRRGAAAAEPLVPPEHLRPAQPPTGRFAETSPPDRTARGEVWPALAGLAA